MQCMATATARKGVALPPLLYSDLPREWPMQCRQFSASSCTDCSPSCTTKSPVLMVQLARCSRAKVALQCRQFSASSSTDSACQSCTRKSPLLSFQLCRLLRVLELYEKVASSQLPALQIAPRAEVVPESRQFSASSLTVTPRTKVDPKSRQFSASSCTDCSAYQSCTRKSPVLSFQLHRHSAQKVALQSRQFFVQLARYSAH